MFRSYVLSPWTRAAADHGCAFDQPGDGGGGGGAPAGGGADAGADPGSADGGADPGADPNARGAAEPDDTDDDHEPDFTTDAIEHLPESKLRTQLRRTQRFNAQARPIVERFRGTDGRFMPAEEVDRIIRNARDFEPIDDVLRRSPRALQIVMDEQRRLNSGEPATADRDETFPEFDEATWPYETESAQGQRLLQMAKDQHETKRTVALLQKQLGQVNQRTEQQTVSGIERTWKDATITAGKELPEEFRPMFIRSVYREFQLQRAGGKLNSADMKRIIDGELKEFRAKNRTTTRQTTTRQSTIVASNTALPRTVRPGAMQPANAQGQPAKRETIADARRSFKDRARQ